jgi:hypothetical protein
MSILPPVLRASTLDLPDLPPLLQFLIGEFASPILEWLETLVTRSLLSRCAEHPLVLLKQFYDPCALVEACKGFHHPPGTPGRPPTFSIEQFVRIELVRAYSGSCSDPALEELLSTNLLVRWFVGLPLTQRAPDHSTLADFHAYLCAHAPEAFFRDSLAFLERVDPEEPSLTPQIIDTFALASCAAPTKNAAHLLRQLCLGLARCWLTSAPACVQAALAPLDLSALTHPGPARTPAARQQQLEAALSVARRLHAELSAQLPTLSAQLRALVSQYLEAIEKLQAEQLSTDASGQVSERSAKQCATRRLVSAVDFSATFRKHEGSATVLGYNAVLSVSATRIRGAVVLTGGAGDCEAPAAVIEQQKAWGEPLAPSYSMDAAGGWGKTRAGVDVRSGGKSRLIAPIPSSVRSEKERFTVAEFEVDAERRECRCPNGVVSRRVGRHPGGEGVVFRYRARDCEGCELWGRCREEGAKATGERSVYISDYHCYMREAQAYNQSEEGRAMLRGRWQVEPVVAWIVRYQGCRRARRAGLEAAQCQLYQACAMRNLLLWLGRQQRREARRARV